ncbi:MAG: peroxide stress protein YaaA [Cyclobacteriaceae bacterium]
MIAIVSPAKTLDFEQEVTFSHTETRFQKESLELIQELKKKSVEDIQKLMSVSENIAQLNVERYHNFSPTYSDSNSKQAAFAFKGDVYLGLEAENFTQKDCDFAQNHFRILSGLYGLLRPLDYIQPYRLEMGTKLPIKGGKNLYDFWGDEIVTQLEKDLADQGDNILINLASNEYFKAVKRKSLTAQLINVEFKDFKNDKYKVISFYAKRARGMMAKYIIKNQLSEVEQLQGFTEGGYTYDPQLSTESELIFKRG